MAQTRVQVLREVKEDTRDGDYLCLQQVIYDHGNGNNSDPCFRFIRRDARTGNMKAQMGQAAIPSLEVITRMQKQMQKIALQFSIS